MEDLIGDIFEIGEVWKKMGEISRHSLPTRLRNGTLLVVVEHPMWKQEIMARSSQIKLFLKQRTGREIDKIKVDVNPAFFKRPPRKHGGPAKLRDRITPEDLLEVLSGLNGEFIRERLKLLYEELKKREET